MMYFVSVDDLFCMFACQDKIKAELDRYKLDLHSLQDQRNKFS